MARGDDGAVVLMVKGGAAKVHHTHCRTLHTALISLLGGKWDRVNHVPFLHLLRVLWPLPAPTRPVHFFFFLV